MTLSELIDGVQSQRRTLTVFDADDAVVTALAERFADRNLVVEAGTADGAATEYAVLSREGSFVTAIDLSGVPADGAGDPPYQAVVDRLDSTMFTSYDTRDMVAASREIEDRAWRVADGSLHAGFQTVSTFEGQSEAYGRLADRGDLDVTAYAYPDESPTDPPCRLRLCRDDEIRTSWFVAFDGGGDDGSKCALVAEERDPRRFYGFWTYGADTVDYVIDYLTRTYAMREPDEEAGV